MIGEQQQRKKVDKVFKPLIESDEANVTNIIGKDYLRQLDPFVNLDFFHVQLPRGFPDHPHRGVETLTYLIKGTMYHEDFKGHKNTLDPGDVQLMTAGKGMVHAEMPGSYDEMTVGLQLWINIEKKDKFCDPNYQVIPSDQIPSIKQQGSIVKVICGEYSGIKGPVVTKAEVLFLDVCMPSDQVSTYDIPKGWNCMCFVYEGEGNFGEDQSNPDDDTAIVFKKDMTGWVEVKTKNRDLKFVLIAGKPLHEQVVQNGPFVMTTNAEVLKTLDDCAKGTHGFEGAQMWKSEIRKLVDRDFWGSYTKQQFL